MGVISPWNYPLALAMADSVPALMAGNAVVLKPDSQTALSPLFAVELLHRAGLPDEVIQVVLGEGPVVGAALVDSADFIAFTGSTRTGTEVAKRAAGRLVGCSLELGGKNPMLVLGDANLDHAADTAVRACFANAGQLCLAIERIYVHEAIFDAFAERFVAQTEKLRLGASYNNARWSRCTRSTPRAAAPTTTRGVTSPRNCAEVALKGEGGRTHDDQGRGEERASARRRRQPATHDRQPPTRPATTPAHRPEASPKAPAALPELSNTASVLGRDVGRAKAIAARVRSGAVNVNDGVVSAYASTDAPMGGMGASGLGRRHGAEGILKYTEGQTVAVQRLPVLSPPRWVPYRTFTKVMVRLLRLMHRLRVR